MFNDNDVDYNPPLLAVGGERPKGSQRGAQVGRFGKISDSIMGLAKKT